MDYLLKPEITRESSGSNSVLGIGLAVGLFVIPYANPLMSRRYSTIFPAQWPMEANTSVMIASSQPSGADTTLIARNRAQRDLWEIYMNSITEPLGRFHSEQIEKLKEVWFHASAILGTCPIPITQPAEDGSLQFAWDNGKKYIDIEVTPQGHFHWYFRDRESDEVLGTSDEAVSTVEPAFFRKLAEVVTTKESAI